MSILIERFATTNWEIKHSETTEAIQFKTSHDLRMTSLSVFHDQNGSIRIKVLRLRNEDETTAEEIGSIDWVGRTGYSYRRIDFKESILIRANIWHVITGTISGSYSYGINGKERVEKDGVVLEFRNSKLSQGTTVTEGQFACLWFEDLTEKDKLFLAEEEKERARTEQEQVIVNSDVFKAKLDEMELMRKEIIGLTEKSQQKELVLDGKLVENEQLKKENIELTEKIAHYRQKELEFNNTINEQSDQILNHQSGIDKLCNALTESSENATGAEMRCRELTAEIQQIRQENCDLKNENIRVKLNALQSARGVLKFNEIEKIPNLHICIQLENGTVLYFDNQKPFGLFTMINGNRVPADLNILEGEYDCSLKGTIGNCAYFSAVRGKTIRFFKASIVNDQIVLEQMNELKTSDILLFNHEPLYFIEDSSEWSVYQNEEKYLEMEGEKFDVSGIRMIRKYEPHYHRGILYFFRENSTAKLDKLNDKVVIVEGPILDGTLSFYNPPHSDFIYIASSDQNALLILNATDLNVSQHNYEPPIESTYHSIVGVHEGILTMLFEGKGVGRCLMTTKLTEI